ncbi:YoaK family protein [Streptomyces sp. DSM 44915]|uniref:YoaK family protein n=1 Tax=Streptomyces chisholmiae TaxID=3075540 RepID=A0ABU2JIL6_9ACTN|nr:YoaK family protein [Streptomyces sp. DSM 44915]MDT0264824.1 YoaK family protein [Streptomyces sp. DSM 44915]
MSPTRMPGTERLALLLTVVLTFVTGVVDAVGFLGLDRVFTGNMTGNIVILGMGAAGADELPVLGPALALVAFAGGALVAGLALRGRPTGWSGPVIVLLAAQSGLLAGLTLALAVLGEEPDPLAQLLIAAGTAAAMGGQAAVARRIGVAEMTTVVVTSTLTTLASESLPKGGLGSIANRRTAAILAIFVGALAGALLLKAHLAVPMGLAAVLSGAVTLLGHYRLRPPATPTA